AAFLKRQHGAVERRLIEGYPWCGDQSDFLEIIEELSRQCEANPDDATAAAWLDRYTGIRERMTERAQERMREEEERRRQREERARIAREFRAAFDQLATDGERLAAYRDGKAIFEWLPEELRLELWRNHE